MPWEISKYYIQSKVHGNFLRPRLDLRPGISLFSISSIVLLHAVLRQFYSLYWDQGKLSMNTGASRTNQKVHWQSRYHSQSPGLTYHARHAVIKRNRGRSSEIAAGQSRLISGICSKPIRRRHKHTLSVRLRPLQWSLTALPKSYYPSFQAPR